jgi:hypothetical protein
MKNVLALIVLLLPTILLSQSNYQEITPIGTRKGAIMVYNFPNSHFTIRVEGERVTPAKQPFVFFVDNRALQLVHVNLKDIGNFAGCNNLEDSLKFHQQYELDYLTRTMHAELVLESRETSRVGSKLFLFWQYNLPPEMKAQLEQQIQLTTIVGDKLLMLKTAGTKQEKVSDLNKWLENFASTRY